MIAWRPPLDEREHDPSLPPVGERPATTVGAQLARELPLLILLAVAMAFLIKTFAAQAFYIPSASMEPQLRKGDRVVVSKLSYHLHDIHRGDVIVFDAPVPSPPDHSSTVRKIVRGVFQSIGLSTPSTQEYIKRVIGLPGETVEVRPDGQVLINGRELIEPYLSATARGQPGPAFPPVKVPAGHLWVMGDNRGDSCDSRCFPVHFIDEKKVVGRAILRVWPTGRLAFL